MILMRVDLPAPFSPTRAWTSPARSSNETSRSAVSPEYDLLMDVACKSGGSGIGAQRSTGILADAGGAGFCVMIRHDRHRPHSSTIAGGVRVPHQPADRKRYAAVHSR